MFGVKIAMKKHESFLKIVIYGKVHNIGYRLLLLEHADYLLIKNFDARNVNAKENKPEKAEVEKIEVFDYSGFVRDIESFRSSFNTSQLGKIANVGLSMLEKQDLTIEEIVKTREELGEKIDNVSEKVDKGFAETTEKLDKISNKLDVFLKG